MGKSRKSRPKGRLSRREFLRRAGWASAAIGAAPLLPGCGQSAGGTLDKASARSLFQHGVASGDPLSDRVMLWTRVTPPNGQASVAGLVDVFRDEALAERLGRMNFVTSADRDFTVKVDFAGLAPGTTYYYRFEAQGDASPVGRTRTAPAGDAQRLRFGVVSCSSYAHGYFNGYAQLARRTDIDAIIHLGDYLYEYGTAEYGDLRPYEPDHEMVSLADYRTRHAYYKQEPDLQELHRLFPFVTVWDDHESTDNSWRDGAVNHTEGAEGVWGERKARAQKAYDEWMPIRYPERGNVGKIFRKLSYGGLVDLFMLDTRLYDRDEPAPLLPMADQIKDPARRMLGPEQFQWLTDGLGASTATWKLIGQQVVMHPWNLVGAPQVAGGGQPLNGDSWDGYQAERAALLSHLRDQRIDNVVVLSGDVHSSWAADVTDDPSNPAVYNPATGAGSVAVEFTTTAITSPFAIDIPEGQQAFLLNNPHIRYTDWDQKGYLLLDVTPERVQGEWWYVSTIEERGGTESFGVGYQVRSGANHLGLAPLLTPSVPGS
jgi:alkaline phosphatase D